jgi:hypothetical protein
MRLSIVWSPGLLFLPHTHLRRIGRLGTDEISPILSLSQVGGFVVSRLVQIKNFAIGQKMSVTGEEAIRSSITQFDSKVGTSPILAQRA